MRRYTRRSYPNKTTLRRETKQTERGTSTSHEHSVERSLCRTQRYGQQWRRPRTRIANLLKLGTSKRHAILTGISRKGYWRLSKTLATQTGMTNEWLEQQGLLSIRKLWMKVQGYAWVISGVCAST